MMSQIAILPPPCKLDQILHLLHRQLQLLVMQLPFEALMVPNLVTPNLPWEETANIFPSQHKALRDISPEVAMHIR